MYRHLILAIIMMVNLLIAAPRSILAATAPQGLYALTPAGRPIAKKLLEHPHLDGIVVRVHWSDLEPEKGNFQWDTLKQELKRVAHTGKHTSLVVVDGGLFQPKWLKHENKIQWFRFTNTNRFHKNPGKIETIPVFWDPTFLKIKLRLIRVMGKNLANLPNLVMVSTQCANATTDDWNFPASEEDAKQWQKFGYSPEKLINACKKIMDTTMEAFPKQTVRMAMGRIASRMGHQPDKVAQEILDYATTRYPGRFSVQRNNLSASTPDPKTEQALYGWKLLLKADPKLVTRGGQMLGAARNIKSCRMNGHQKPCDPVSMLKKAGAIGNSYGLSYIEIYGADATYPKLAQTVEQLANNLKEKRSTPTLLAKSAPPKKHSFLDEKDREDSRRNGRTERQRRWQGQSDNSNSPSGNWQQTNLRSAARQQPQNGRMNFTNKSDNWRRDSQNNRPQNSWSQQRRHGANQQQRKGSFPVDSPPETWNWVNPPSSGRHTPTGVSHQTFNSKAMGQKVGFTIFLPKSYSHDNKRYPVIYWLHGKQGDESRGVHLISFLQDAIKQGVLPEIIQIFVNGGRASFYSDSFDGRFPVETMLITELIPHVDSKFRTIPNRKGRLLDGFSMGGFGALKLAGKYPDMFGSVSTYGGALLDRDNPPKRHDAKTLEFIFNNDLELFLANTPAHWFQVNRDRIKALGLPVRLVAGGADGTRRYIQSFHRLLEKLKIPHEFLTLEGVRHAPKLYYQADKGRVFNFHAKSLKNLSE
ncbi:MAG: beta-galactosidase [Magnetococcales bacterium]|nr:beta-galactosidase [Magnetococcales bacterium]